MRILGIVLVLATLALPAASAFGDVVYDAADQVDADLGAALDAVFIALPVVFDEPRGEDAAQERERAQHEEPARESASEPASPPSSAPASGGSLGGTLAAPVARLVPVPVSNLVGAAPRLDLLAITGGVPDLSPAAAPARAPAPAPSALPAPASAPEPVAAASQTATVVALGVAATASVAAPAAGALWERLRRLGFLALLYSRIAKERLLDHGTRERLLDAIRAQPGLAVADLAEAARVPRNTVTYHLRVLEREGLVSS
ncbi:MAG TPA: helix-turn-helix domain-containing protein, partial [Candidatus Thermoplasmatota archaeon]|nr:helix-turn-helix domain-containing protein [Candidatus Thermoplasmatota archaeon]